VARPRATRLRAVRPEIKKTTFFKKEHKFRTEKSDPKN